MTVPLTIPQCSLSHSHLSFPILSHSSSFSPIPPITTTNIRPTDPWWWFYRSDSCFACTGLPSPPNLLAVCAHFPGSCTRFMYFAVPQAAYGGRWWIPLHLATAPGHALWRFCLPCCYCLSRRTSSSSISAFTILLWNHPRTLRGAAGAY